MILIRRYLFSVIILIVFIAAYQYPVLNDPFLKFTGFLSLKIDSETILTASFFSFLPLVFDFSKHNRPFQGLVKYIPYYILYVPSIFFLCAEPTISFFTQIYFNIVLSLAFVFFIYIVNKTQLSIVFLDNNAKLSPREKQIINFSSAIFLIISIVVFLISAPDYGSSSFIEFAFNPYSYRADQLSDVSRRYAFYFANYSTAFFLPFLMMANLLTRQRAFFVINIATLVFLYLTTTFRSVLVIPILSVVLAIIVLRSTRRSYYYSLGVFFLSITALPLIAESVLKLPGTIGWSIYFRIIGNNGFLTSKYFSFFSNNKLALFQDYGLSRAFGLKVYDRPIPLVVGEKFLNVKDNFANASFIADGYSNAGIPGIFLAILSLILCILILASQLSRIPSRLSVFALAPIASFLLIACNTSIFSALFSNGFVTIFFGLALIQFKKNSY